VKAEKDQYRLQVDEQLTIDLDRKNLDLEIFEEEGNILRFRVDGKNYEAECIKLDAQKKVITIFLNGTPFQINIQDHIDLLIEEMGLETSQNQDVKEILAPMPGQVQKVLVEKGQEVNEGDGLLILVAMKMENLIKSPISGIIDEVLISDEQIVDKNQEMITFE
jgi:biotin carboxyl carrier protein